MTMKNNILIIGNGFVGKKMYNYLNSNNFTNSEIYHLYSLKYFDQTGGINVIENSIICNHIDYVINCVGYTGSPNVDGCEDNKEDTWYLNVVFPTIVAGLCAKYKAKLINISSGCVYSGYDKEYTEECTPNYGLFTDNSSWYSKTKHACELSLKQYDNAFNFRIRMPITGDVTESKNYLTKILKYNNLIDFVNSKTVIEDLLDFTQRFIITDKNNDLPSGNYNVVNPIPLSTEKVTNILDDYGLWNPHWKWIDLSELYKSTKCGRSNCVLDMNYTTNITGIKLPTEEESIRKVLENGK